MQLLIKQRLFAWADSFDIYDENEQVRYTVKGKPFAFTHQLRVYEPNADEPIGVLRQKPIAWMPTFYIEFYGETVGTVTRRFTWGRPIYDVDLNGWRVEGNLFGHEYTVYDGEQPLMHITKKIWSASDTYVLDVVEPAHERLALMLVLAIDAATRLRD